MIKTVAVYQTVDGIKNTSGGGGAGGAGAGAGVCTHYRAKPHQRIGGYSEILNMDTFGWVGVPEDERDSLKLVFTRGNIKGL